MCSSNSAFSVDWKIPELFSNGIILRGDIHVKHVENTKTPPGPQVAAL